MIVDKFNKTIFEFFTNITKVYPDMKIFTELKAKLRVALMSDDTLAINNFYSHVTKKYKQQILKEDEEFFLSFDLTGTVLEDLNCLKEVWLVATPNTKKSIWKYVKILLVLSQKFCS